MDLDKNKDKDTEQNDTDELQQGSCLKRAFPSGFKYEAWELLKYAWPVVATQLFSRLIRITPTVFSGQIGKLELGGVSMAVSMVNMAASSIGIGMIAATETSFSQSFGSKNKKQVGVYLQTGIYLTTLLCFVSWGFLLNANSLLLVLGQNVIISQYTEDYLFIFMPAIIFLLMYQLLSRYIQAQGFLMPCVFIGLSTTIIDFILQYLLVDYGDFGLKGSAAAQLMSYFILFAGIVVYLLYTKCYVDTWPGWSLASLEDWGPFFRLAMSTVLMISVEWWAFEVSMLLMGLLGPVELGANSIMYQIYMVYDSISLGFGSAIAYRVGRCLGSETPVKAKTVARVALVMGLILASVTATVTLCLRWQLPHIFSNNPDVDQLGGELLPLLAVFSFFGATKNVCAGIVRGTGRQHHGAICITVGYLVIALPIGIPLMFLTNAKAAGFWYGLSLGQGMAVFSLVIMVFKLNWDVEVDRALVRAKIVIEPSEPESSEPRASTSNARQYGTVRKDTVIKSSSYWKRLIIKRSLVAVLCILVLVIAILTRYVFWIPSSLRLNTGTGNTSSLQLNN